MNETAQVSAHFRTTAVRPGPLGLLREAVTEMLGRRRLIAYLVQADMKKKGADTLLGNIWWVLDPLLQMIVYVVFVSVVLQRGGPDYPLFIFSAILPWKWFQTSVQDGITSVTSADKLIRQIQFPKLVLPVSTVVAGIINFAFGLIPLVGLILLLYRDRLTATLFLIPVIAAVQFFLNLGLAIGLGALNVFYRDVGNVSRHVLRMWFYLSPALYSIESLQKGTENLPILGPLLLLNPWTTLFTAYRDVIYYSRMPNWTGLAEVLVGSLLLFALLTYAFKRAEPSFAKVL